MNSNLSRYKIKSPVNKVIKDILFLFSIIAFFVMALPRKYLAIFVGIIVSISVFVYVYTKEDNIRKHYNKKTSVFGMFLSFVVAFIFYINWRYANIISVLSNMFSIEQEILIIVLCITGFVFTLPFSIFLCDKVNNLYIDIKYENRVNTHLDILDILLCIIVSFFVCTRFCSSPTNSAQPFTDSSVFLYIGKMMKNGFVPYLDLFDHKGLLLYFYELFAWCISDKSYIGLWILELLNMFFASLAILKVSKLFSNRIIVNYTTLILVLFICGSNCWEGGNLTEEYALPWILFSLYVFFKYFITKDFKIYEIVFLGVAFIAVLMLRVNMIALWAIFIPLVLFVLIFDKKWNDLSRSIVGFLIGVLIGMIPFAIYLISTESIDGMIKYYIMFNLGYSGQVNSLSSRIDTAIWFVSVLGYMSFVPLLFVLILRHDRYMLYNLLFMLVSLVMVNMSGYQYAHYAIIVLPTIIIPLTSALDLVMNYVENYIFKKNTYNYSKSLSIALSLVLIYLICYPYGFNFKKDILGIGITKDSDSIIVKYITDNSDKEDDVLILGNRCQYYLESDRKTNNRFFYQSPPVNYNEELLNEFFTELEDKKPDLIIVDKQQLYMNVFGQNLEKAFYYIETLREKGYYRLEDYNEFLAYIKEN